LRKILFFVSDMHYGRRTAGWNVKQAAKTIQKFQNKLLAIIRSEKATAVGICFLGDILDGESVFPFQANEQEMVGLEQAFEGCELFWNNLIAPLSEHVDVHLDGVPGNHAFLKGAHPKTNLDTLLYRLLAERSKDNKRVFAKFGLQQTDTLEVKVTRMLNHDILIGHGHFLQARGGLPFQGTQVRVLQWLERWRQVRANVRVSIAAFGHFHRFSVFKVAGTFVLFNGTALKHDEWAITRYGSDGDRIWAALIVSEKGVDRIELLTCE